MTDQEQSKTSSGSDEIDLGQLMQLIKNGFHDLGNFFLRVFIYLRKNILKLLGLLVLGLAISFGLNQIISKKLKTDVIVRPNFESKNYLYEVVDEVAANIKARNMAFFDPLSIAVDDLKGFQVEVAAIEDEEVQSDEGILNEMKYLEVLQNFKDESFVIDILRSELSEKSVIDHKITFTYKNGETGPDIVKKLMTYINTNDYFDGLKATYAENNRSRMEKNAKLIEQIDQLIDNYSKALLSEKSRSEGTLVMEGDNALNVPLLLNLKNELSREIEVKRLEAAQQTGVLSILNFGQTHEVKKSFFNQTYFLIPTLLVVGFLFFSFIQYLGRKAREIE